MNKLPFELAENWHPWRISSKRSILGCQLLLQEIHSALRQQPENVILLSEEEISSIVEGLKIQTGVAFAQAAVAGKGSSKKKFITVDMI